MRNRFPGSGIPFLHIKDLPQHKFCLPESVRSATLIEWAGVNGIASIQNIEKADQIVPLILQRGLNPFLASIFIAGIVAAGMSTIDGILVTTTIVASIVMIVVSKLTKTPPQETIDRHFAA